LSKCWTPSDAKCKWGFLTLKKKLETWLGSLFFDKPFGFSKLSSTRRRIYIPIIYPIIPIRKLVAKYWMILVGKVKKNPWNLKTLAHSLKTWNLGGKGDGFHLLIYLYISNNTNLIQIKLFMEECGKRGTNEKLIEGLISSALLYYQTMSRDYLITFFYVVMDSTSFVASCKGGCHSSIIASTWSSSNLAQVGILQKVPCEYEVNVSGLNLYVIIITFLKKSITFIHSFF
jgi:hypothetical protein